LTYNIIIFFLQILSTEDNSILGTLRHKIWISFSTRVRTLFATLWVTSSS